MAELLYQGKTKEMWTTDDPEVLRAVYKDDATALDGLKHDVFQNKDYMGKTLLNERPLEPLDPDDPASNTQAPGTSPPIAAPEASTSDSWGPHLGQQFPSACKRTFYTSCSCFSNRPEYGTERGFTLVFSPLGAELVLGGACFGEAVIHVLTCRDAPWR